MASFPPNTSTDTIPLTRRRSWVQSAVPAVLALTAFVITGCHRDSPVSNTASLPAIKVAVTAVRSHGLPAVEEVVGTVHSKLRATVEARVPGRIEALLAVPGQRVKAGETLVVLDSREVQARLDSALAVREQAQRDLDRISKLVKDGAVTQADLDATQARQRVAAAAVTEAETMLNHTRVTAPFAGVITRKFVDVGDLAVTGRPLLEIEDPALLRFEADVPEALLEFIPMGAALSLTLGNSAAGVMTGRVSEISPIAESLSRTYLVKLDLPPTTGVRAGQFGRVAVPTGEADAAHVPTNAVVQRGQLEFVYISTNGRAQLRLVRTGKRRGGEVELVSGAEPGEQVIVLPAVGLQDGQPVQVVP